MKVKITPDEKLQAFALWTMSKHHNEETGRYYEGLLRTLGFAGRQDDPGNVSDSIWGFDGSGNLAEFEQLLRNLGVVVEQPPE